MWTDNIKMFRDKSEAMAEITEHKVVYIILLKFRQPSQRRAAYCIPHGLPPPQLFVFKIATNLSTSASSYFTQWSHTTGELFWWHFDPHIINPVITTATNEEMSLARFRKKVIHQIFLVFGKYAQLCQPKTWLTFGSKQLQIGLLSYIWVQKNIGQI